MKKKAFTLVELVAVVVIIGLIALITVPVINQSLKKSKQNLYERQIKTIEESARKWGTENMDILDSVDRYQLRLSTLKQEGYLEQKDTTNPIDQTIMNGCILITFDEAHQQYKYEYLEESC